MLTDDHSHFTEESTDRRAPTIIPPVWLIRFVRRRSLDQGSLGAAFTDIVVNPSLSLSLSRSDSSIYYFEIPIHRAGVSVKVEKAFSRLSTRVFISTFSIRPDLGSISLSLFFQYVLSLRFFFFFFFSPVFNGRLIGRLINDRTI